MPATLEKKGGKLKLPSNEQAVVDEFTNVIRKHQDQTPAALARLVRLAFEFTLGAEESRDDKLARAHIRGLGARQQLAEAEGGSWSSDDVARLLEISKTAVLKRLAAGRLLAWREERLQAARFPRWQFDEHGQVLNGLEEVLGTSVTLFSYPFGGPRDYDRTSEAICREAGFARVAANFPGLVHRWTNPYAMPRRLVRNWDRETFAIHLERFLYR